MIRILLTVVACSASSFAATTAVCGYVAGSQPAGTSGDGITHSDCSARRIDGGGGGVTADVIFTDSVLTARVAYGDYAVMPNGVSGSALWTQEYYVTISGGSGTVFLNPCLLVFALPGHFARASAGPVSMVGGSAQPLSTCGGTFPGPLSTIQATFDREFNLLVDVIARASSTAGPPASGGTASATFLYSFEGWTLDQNTATRLDNLTWTLTPVPEPATALPVLVLMAAGAIAFTSSRSR